MRRDRHGSLTRPAPFRKPDAIVGHWMEFAPMKVSYTNFVSESLRTFGKIIQTAHKAVAGQIRGWARPLGA